MIDKPGATAEPCPLPRPRGEGDEALAPNVFLSWPPDPPFPTRRCGGIEAYFSNTIRRTEKRHSEKEMKMANWQ